MTDHPVRLGVGNHPTPAAGRCLMEHVSVLAGEPFRALPRCTHPAVAALATQVNDRASEAGRRAVLRRAPALTRADVPDPALSWRLVADAARIVLEHRPGDRAAARRLARARRAERRWDRLLPGRRARRLPRRLVVAAALTAVDDLVAAVDAVPPAAGPPGSPARDRALLALLDAALARTAVPPPGPGPRPAAPTLQELSA